MEHTDSLQDNMYSEIRNTELFQHAHAHGLRYLESAFSRSTYPVEAALNGLKQFEEELPVGPSDVKSVVELLNQYGAPATVATTGGRHFGFVVGSVLPVGLAVKSMTTFWDQTGSMQVLSPVASKLESVVEGWLKRLFGLPEGTVAGFVTGTSAATFCGLAAARYRLLKRAGWDVNESGLRNAPPIRIVTGKHAHSTAIKAIAMLGFGKGCIEWVETDDQGRVIPGSVPSLDDRTILILQAGNVNGGSFDPFEDIWKKVKESGAWIHIDGAFGLWAAACDQLKQLTHGIAHADSWAVDGHKTVNTPYDCGVILCSDQEALMSALHLEGSYIVHGKDRDGMYFTPDMSQRARAIELWATLKYLGKKGISELVLQLHRRAVLFAEELRRLDGFLVLNDVVFNQVLVRCESDEITDRVISRVQDQRICWVGGASWNGNRVIRISVCSWATTVDDVRRSVSSFKSAYELAKMI